MSSAVTRMLNYLVSTVSHSLCTGPCLLAHYHLYLLLPPRLTKVPTPWPLIWEESLQPILVDWNNPTGLLFKKIKVHLAPSGIVLFDESRNAGATVTISIIRCKTERKLFLSLSSAEDMVYVTMNGRVFLHTCFQKHQLKSKIRSSAFKHRRNSLETALWVRTNTY